MRDGIFQESYDTPCESPLSFARAKERGRG
jgi:hypothetical protein